MGAVATKQGIDLLNALSKMGGDLYTAIENMIKGKVEETIIRP